MKKVKIITIALTALTLLFSWGLGIWALNLEDFKAPELMIFLGRFHPLILHLPIGFMVLALLIDFGNFLPKSLRGNLPDSTWLYWLIMLATTATVIHGILLYAGDGYESSELARRHLIGGCIFLSLIAVIFSLKVWFTHSTKMRLASAPMGVIAMVALSISAHDGASLTHGEKYLSQHAPEILKPLLEPGYQKPAASTTEELAITDQDLYHAVIQPIFDRTCVECHKASKSKGDFRMDSYEQLIKGGDSGESFVANNTQDSLLLERIHLPMDDDDHMPPEGKKQPTQKEVAILEWWIEIGAPAEGAVASYNPSDEILNAITSIHEGTDEIALQEEESASTDTSKELPTEISEFNKNHAGQLVVLNSGTELAFRCGDDPLAVDNDLLEELHPFGESLVELDLSGSKITTSGLSKLIQKSPNLQKLILTNCRISDKITEDADSLSQLQTLDLSGTKITDEGIALLYKLPQLKRLTLKNTAVTKTAYRNRPAGLEVIF